MEQNIEGSTQENFNNIFKIMSNTCFESLLFRNFGLNTRSIWDIFVFFTSLMIATVFIIVHILTFQENFADAMFQVAVMCHSFCLMVRIITVFIYRHEILALTSVNFREFNSNQKRPILSLSILKEGYFYLKKLEKFMNGNFFVLIGCWYVMPAIISKAFLGLLVGHNGLEEVIRILPTTFPDKDTSITLHVLSWAFHIVFASVFIRMWCTFDALCFGVTIFLKKQYLILRNSLFWHHGISADSWEPLTLKEFVQDHVKLIRMTNMLRDILGPIVGAQMMHAIFITGCATYVAAKETTDSGNKFVANFVAYSLICLMELLAFCWQSQIVNEANENLGFVIYQFALNDSICKDSKDWYSPLLMSQKTIQYKALGLVEINMETFLGVLRASYSYYTLMQAKE